MNQFQCVLQHVPGVKRTTRPIDLLMRRWQVLDEQAERDKDTPTIIRVKVVEADAPATEDFPVPSKSEVRDRQGAHAEGQLELDTALGKVSRG